MQKEIKIKQILLIGVMVLWIIIGFSQIWIVYSYNQKFKELSEIHRLYNENLIEQNKTITHLKEIIDKLNSILNK